MRETARETAANERRFYRLAERDRRTSGQWCPTCGSSRAWVEHGWDYCPVCRATGARPNDFRLAAVAWREAVAARKRGEFADVWFGRLTFAAKVEIVREMRTRRLVAEFDGRSVAPTVLWLERGLPRPGFPV
jgi:hypothetical protein